LSIFININQHLLFFIASLINVLYNSDSKNLG